MNSDVYVLLYVSDKKIYRILTRFIFCYVSAEPSNNNNKNNGKHAYMVILSFAYEISLHPLLFYLCLWVRDKELFITTVFLSSHDSLLFDAFIYKFPVIKI